MNAHKKIKLDEIPKMYSGEISCQGKYADGRSCKELGRYSIENNTNIIYLCGTHSKKYKDRITLKKNPKSNEYRENLIKQRLIDAKNMMSNRDHADIIRLPNVITTKLKMFKEYTLAPELGYLPIYPNRKHSHGFGYGVDCSGLSPMKLGPVKHGQYNLPEAKNIENYHQFNKAFPCELTKIKCNCPRSKEWKHFTVGEDFYKRRLEGYNDNEPHRHKFERNEIKKDTKDKNVNIPSYSIHIDKHGVERHYTYVESRYFYCKQMELLATKSQHFRSLNNLLQQGYKLEIIGYDAYRINAYTSNDLYVHYCDSKRPFGHEMVIMTLLTLNDSDDFPWNRYYREHQEIYE